MKHYHKNSNNPAWKGNAVGLEGLHEWVRRHKPKPALCECCNEKPPYDLANVSGKYKRDIMDFQWLCRLCHMQSDGRLAALKVGSQRALHIRNTRPLHERSASARQAGKRIFLGRFLTDVEAAHG